VTSHRTDAGSSADDALWPVGDATVSFRTGRDRAVDLALRVSPLIDRLTGLIDERGQASVAVRSPLGPHWSTRANVGASTTLYSHDAKSMALILGEVVLAWRPIPEAVFELGARSAWQRQEGLETPIKQWLGFVAATVTSGTLGGRT
jgi:hypothetical protein